MYQNNKYQVAIIGAGFAGIGAAIRLKKEGRQDFIILERAGGVGGTWRDNIYPGCGCDVPSHLYSYSFELNPNWSRSFSRQPEILAYIKKCAEKHDLEKYIRFNTEIINAVFDEKNGRWNLSDKQGNTISARVVISAIGPLNVPNIPAFKNQNIFKGTSFHSSEWDYDFNLNNKRVAVIGTGASAIQFVPEIAPQVKKLYLFQRTAPWVIPKMDHRYSAFSKFVFNKIPGTQRLLRELIYWLMELRGMGFFGNKLAANMATWLGKRHIRKSIKDPGLRKKVLPPYQIGCKRILPSDHYYPALERPNVELITEGIDSFQTNGIRSKTGLLREVDAIIYATGFHSSEFIHHSLKVTGRHGRQLMEEWKTTGPEAYYGITVSGYPGWLFMLGPNTGLGHTSVIHMMESQLNYIMDYLQKLEASPTPFSFLDLKPAVQKQFNEHIQNKLSGMVWASGCKSWYQTSFGKNTTLWPGFTVTYRKETKKVQMADYEVL